MVGDFAPEEPVQHVPITAHESLQADDVEAGIRERLQNYRGEELVKQIVDYFMLSLIEVVLTKDPDPKRLERLSEDKLTMLQNLTPGLITKEDIEN